MAPQLCPAKPSLVAMVCGQDARSSAVFACVLQLDVAAVFLTVSLSSLRDGL
jgi:hypothetical protein